MQKESKIRIEGTYVGIPTDHFTERILTVAIKNDDVIPLVISSFSIRWPDGRTHPITNPENQQDYMLPYKLEPTKKYSIEFKSSDVKPLSKEDGAEILCNDDRNDTYTAQIRWVG